MKLDISIEPPVKVEREHYILEVLAPKHNERDYEAWTSSRESLKGIFGPRNDWPGDVADLNGNLKDLENHLREFEEREAYTYSILSLDESRCIGCLYIRPTPAKEFSARVDFWFTDENKEFEREFLFWLQVWLTRDWKFKTPCFPGRSITWDEYYKRCERIG
jgi:hypothetical protein